MPALGTLFGTRRKTHQCLLMICGLFDWHMFDSSAWLVAQLPSNHRTWLKGIHSPNQGMVTNLILSVCLFVVCLFVCFTSSDTIGQHWIRWWLVWRHQAITSTYVGLPLAKVVSTHAPENNFTVSALAIILYNEFQNFYHITQGPMF